MKNQIEILILTGFLGSGKTTLLKTLLSIFSNVKVAVLMNEFGEIDVDGQILEKDGFYYKEVTGGSIFCNCRRDQFIDAMILLKDLQPDLIIIESSGMSDPHQFYKDFLFLNTKFNELFEFKGTIGIIDAVNFFDLYETTEILKRQISFSNIILINKLDLGNKETTEEIEIVIKVLNPNAEIQKTEFCKIDTYLMNRIIEMKHEKTSINVKERGLNTKENAPERIQLCTTDSKLVPLQSIIDFIQNIIDITYRIKGYLRVKEGTVLFNCVSKRLDWEYTTNEIKNYGLVCIFKEQIDYLMVEKIQEEWEKIMNT